MVQQVRNLKPVPGQGNHRGQTQGLSPFSSRNLSLSSALRQNSTDTCTPTWRGWLGIRINGL